MYLFLDIHKKKHRVYWSDTQLSFNGTPYMVVNQKSFGCQHGKDRKKSQKSKEFIKSDKKIVSDF